VQLCTVKLSVILAGIKGSFGDTHAHLSSGHDIPLLGWGSFHASAEDAVTAVQDAVHAGFRVGARVPATVSASECWRNWLVCARHSVAL
jgi:diketogulonate reductase-like aldo/keto reductase